MSILAGIELLGALVSTTSPVNKQRKIEGDKHFTHFWNYYLGKQNPKYCGFGQLFYHLLRNGIAHSFVVKQGVDVYKSTDNHMKYNQEEKRIAIGCKQFMNDLRETYHVRVEPLVAITSNKEGVNRETVQRNLDDMLDLFKEESDNEFGKIQSSKNLRSKQSGYVPISSASGSTTRQEDLHTTASGIAPLKPKR